MVFSPAQPTAPDYRFPPPSVNDVTFPCGCTIRDDGETLNLYYGAADICIALALGSIHEILHWLDLHGSR